MNVFFLLIQNLKAKPKYENGHLLDQHEILENREALAPKLASLGRDVDDKRSAWSEHTDIPLTVLPVRQQPPMGETTPNLPMDAGDATIGGAAVSASGGGAEPGAE